MRTLLDVFGVAVASLRSRKGRTALMAIGPLLGVAAIVGALGLSTSAKAQVRAALEEMGANVILASASAEEEDPRLPKQAAERAARLDGVAGAAELTPLNKVTVSRVSSSADSLASRSLTVLATSPDLATVAGAEVASGRFLNQYDQGSSAPVAVIGANAANMLGMLPDEQRTILLDGQRYGVIGVLEPVPLLPELDDTVLITSAAARQFDPKQAPSSVVVRAHDGMTNDVAEQLGLAITYGDGPSPSVRVPSDLLAARAEVDRTLQLVIIAMGGLAMTIGGLGIANVMTISVLQRSTEIGVRRALGHRRVIIAGQFLVEAAAVGLLGAVCGLLVGFGFVAAAAYNNGWAVAVDPAMAAGTVALSVIVALIAGSYPAGRAARLEPSIALRST